MPRKVKLRQLWRGVRSQSHRVLVFNASKLFPQQGQRMPDEGAVPPGCGGSGASAAAAAAAQPLRGRVPDDVERADGHAAGVGSS
eukprot:CAMPEP_0206404266 /NCGR_PEP_ID=MMETSP0294-20121207/28257_1 /ASSEMBLY_ACC=CAM_ASM_000327 /TAXON_ID=39354 /ORGANISM="Heterosigma akashiwo, Strain CCMP2393" /LENGTH=84 /DNA_ID=CAMNT_0053862113 /DNA_START=312 /DNA_END=563 /DNA_ORIENTATION=+